MAPSDGPVCLTVEVGRESAALTACCRAFQPAVHCVIVTGRWTAKGFARASVWVHESNVLGQDFYRRTGWVSDGSGREIDIDGTPHQELRLTRSLG